MKHIHGGLAAFLFVMSVVILLHFFALLWTSSRPDSNAAMAFAAAVG